MTFGSPSCTGLAFSVELPHNFESRNKTMTKRSERPLIAGVSAKRNTVGGLSAINPPPPTPRAAGEWSMAPTKWCTTIADVSEPRLPARPDCVRWARCQRQADRQGRFLIRDGQTGLYQLDNEPDMLLDEVEAELFGLDGIGDTG